MAIVCLAPSTMHYSPLPTIFSLRLLIRAIFIGIYDVFFVIIMGVNFVGSPLIPGK